VRSRRFINLLIAGYVAFQGLYPIRGLVQQKFDTIGDFTWNMYSQTYTCTRRYSFVDASGAHPVPDFGGFFRRPEKLPRAFHRDILPIFHKFLCDQIAAQGKSGRLTGFLECTRNKAESEVLVNTDGKICTAPNYGVTK